MNRIKLPGEAVSSSWLEVVANGGSPCCSLDEVFAVCGPSAWRRFSRVRALWPMLDF